MYTSTRSKLFYFDDFIINGTAFVDYFPKPTHSDILINEVLFNPYDGGDDFVEFVSVSYETLNIKDLKLGNYFAGKPDNLKLIAEGYSFMSPNEVLVVTKSASNLKEYYPNTNTSKVIELLSLPSYNNEEGAVVLTYYSIIIDEFFYREDMHFIGLNNTEGVSLERISLDVQTNQKSNWHSSAESIGFATPTEKNSHALNLYSSKDILSTSTKLFSPNSDGYLDVLTIKLNFQGEGYTGRILIFDEHGTLVKTLVNHTLFGTENTFFWDGSSDRRHKLATGRYILYLEAVHQQLPIVTERLSVVLNQLAP